MQIPYENINDKKDVIMGAGPVELTAAHELRKAGIPSLVIKEHNVVGWLARLVEFKCR